ncbi:GGDEF domain-containing protein [Shewanella donghaensis]|uniref:GGDEF domain-containing protein n=1 Tax=Shewanella donghaensis TaxID=238836 RepID=UPI001181FFD9|nr:GGDEF domain-containing protein [Shewanella donghaensis]
MSNPIIKTIGSTSLNLIQVRLLIIIGTSLLASFMIADLALVPDSLASIYTTSRLYLQFPICFAFLLSSFHPKFPQFYQIALAITMLWLVYVNYWLIIMCWQVDRFPFPYEGTVMYSLFTLFVFRMSFKYSIPFSIIVLGGFAFILFYYPIYGDKNAVNLGFVFVGLIVGLMGVLQIENALKKLSKANDQLNVLSQIDHLTDIYNRRTYESRFTEQLSLNNRVGDSICVFIIDLDYFKHYNDGYGHVKGDNIIKLQASNLKKVFRRTSDIVARYGGEEFVVVTTQVNEAQCIELANRIIAQWQQLKEPHGQIENQQHVTCSVGFYLEKINEQSSKVAMVKKADKALYQAKENGRNCFVQYTQ